MEHVNVQSWKIFDGDHWKTADKICCFNRHYAEHSGYFLSTKFVAETKNLTEPITFYDSVSGKPLFIAPKGRSYEEFLDESIAHGWPSFRDEEVVWENVRCLANGEAVSLVEHIWDIIYPIVRAI